MKRSLSLALLFVLGCATGGVASQVVIPSARAGIAPQRWEHFCMENPSAEGLNKAGSEGWELVTVTSHPNVADYMFCFKRPVI
jgi:hypothetical protein